MPGPGWDELTPVCQSWPQDSESPKDKVGGPALPPEAGGESDDHTCCGNSRVQPSEAVGEMQSSKDAVEHLTEHEAQFVPRGSRTQSVLIITAQCLPAS